MGKEISDKTSVIENIIKKGYITFNFDNYRDTDNFFVRRPDLILNYLTGKKWEVRKVSASLYKPEDGEYVVEGWGLNNTVGHFARVKSHNFNSLQYSANVTHGEIISYRVCKVIQG